MSTCPHAHEDGAYVLGALSPEERVAFERHLDGCADCARSVTELAGLPGLLARVPVEVVDPDELPQPVPETLLPALVRRVRRTQRRRARFTTGLVAAAAAVAIGAVGVASLGGDDEGSRAAPAPSSPTTAPSALMQPAAVDPPISGWLSLTEVGWGTRLDLTCSYETPDGGYGYDYGPPTYTMHVRTEDGAVEQVASWKGLPGRTLHLVAATSADRPDIAAVEVRDAAGETLLELR